MIKYLTPTTVMVQSECKFFGLEKGSSDGSIVSMTFDVHPDSLLPENKNLFRAALFREKLSLDLIVLNMERMKGSLPRAIFDSRVTAVKGNYDLAIARLEAEAAKKDGA